MKQITDNKINVYKDALIFQLEKIINTSDEKIKKLESELNSKNRKIEVITDLYERYVKGFNMLHEYFDSIPDDEKQNVDKILMELGL